MRNCAIARRPFPDKTAHLWLVSVYLDNWRPEDDDTRLLSEAAQNIQAARFWVPALALILATNAVAAFARCPLGTWRWPLAALVLCAPATFPAHGTYFPVTWGAADTVLTTMAIVSAARLPALDRLLSDAGLNRWQIFFWMTVPVARFWPDTPEGRAKNRRRAPRFLLSALAKRLAWESIAYLTVFLDGAGCWDGGVVPWPLRSAALILYFVLNVTAAADALMALCLLLGCDIDELFDAPLLSYSPRDFWSRRWNKFINRFALKHVALPLGKRWGTWAVILGVFATSGAFHEYFAWGVGGALARHGYMSVFFLIQGVMVWAGARVKLSEMPHVVGTGLTFLWMVATAPLFFAAVEPALSAFGFPPTWFPFRELVVVVEGVEAPLTRAP